MRIRTPVLILSAAGVLGLGLLSACDGAPTVSSDTPAPAPSATTGSAASSAATTTSLSTKDISGLGTVVTDQGGRTLYLFTNDTTSPPASNCTGSCATAWPPAVVSGAVPATGIGGTVGTVTRSDGARQLTLNGNPLYRYAGDSAAGQANGQGIGGSWFAISPQGRKVTMDDNGTDNGSSSSSSGNGYNNGY
jgi:predicted lipoprotein with Yx(FWY)xxD motif